ncbi:MAG: hypothetical protein ABS52_04945 [Gemmatimonadetes bacterium SCN 70-22]|nr:MAG: hypothetical protein ABS52_04945 [Gemmatimonadetes bacterium SCN 70-22]
MRGTVHAVASPAVATGFRLAGVPATEAEDGVAATAVLQRLAAMHDCGILLVEQSLLAGIPDEARAGLERSAVPLVVPVPAPSWGEEARGGEDYILALLQRAIGYRVRLQ